ncbi:hypothetical protein [Allofournierella sp.]|uniref:hypothetical protein n=1 Tax=Allofournierella sp. TaxID=1940256 RepID=UPI003AF0A6C2
MDKPRDRAAQAATAPHVMAPIVYLVHPVTGEHCYTCRGRHGYTLVPRRNDLDAANKALGVEPEDVRAAECKLLAEWGEAPPGGV